MTFLSAYVPTPVRLTTSLPTKPTGAKVAVVTAVLPSYSLLTPVALAVTDFGVTSYEPTTLMLLLKLVLVRLTMVGATL